MPPAEKASARRLVADALPLAGRGGAEVVVRVNNDPAHLWDDVAAAVHPGLDGLALPKAESPEQIRELVRRIEALETRAGDCARACPPLARHRDAPRPAARRGDRRVERPHRHDGRGRRGLLPRAGRRAVGGRRSSCSTRSRGWSPSPRPRAFSRRGSWAASRAFGTSARSRARRRARASSAARARAASIPTRSPCSTACSRPIPPRSSTRGGSSRRSRKGIKRGTASVNLDGKMVDIPVVKRAEVVLARARVVEETERHKAEARARLG